MITKEKAEMFRQIALNKYRDLLDKPYSEQSEQEQKAVIILAKIGMVALVDEATKFQDVRMGKKKDSRVKDGTKSLYNMMNEWLNNEGMLEVF